MYYAKPRLWLRLAECCISAHVHKLAESAESAFKSVSAPKTKTTRRPARPASFLFHVCVRLSLMAAGGRTSCAVWSGMAGRGGSCCLP
jgi:hypothetical protein